MKKGASGGLDSGEDSLDLIVPSKSDFDALARTLEDLLAFYMIEEPCENPDYAWIQYHLADMGKSLGGSGGGEERSQCLVSASDWVTLCKRWNAPVSKAEATAMYREFCDSLAISRTQSDSGLEMFEVVRLLEVLRQRGLSVAGGTGGSPGKKAGGAAVEDPRKRLFRKIAQTKSADGHGEAISAEEFLSFIRDRQKESEMELSDVKDLFYQLNGHRVSPQLEDAISVISSGYRSSSPTVVGGEGVSWEREYITWEAFGRYLLLESNDVFDPARASPSDR